MRILFSLGAAALLWLAGPAGLAAVSVAYAKPEQFSDFPRSAYEQAPLLEELTKELTRLGSGLPEGQQLTITIDDIDLAGQLQWTRWQHQELRILTGGADWPRIRLRYALEADGRPIRSGAATLSDMNYLYRARRQSSNAPLRYEKAMLDDWFVHTFGVGVPLSGTQCRLPVPLSAYSGQRQRPGQPWQT